MAEKVSRKMLALIAVSFLLLATLPVCVNAGGIVIPGGTGTANNLGAGGTSLVDDGFVFLNPATLGFKTESGFQLSYEGIYTDFAYNASHSKEAFHLPTFSLFHNSNNGFTFGLGGNTPYGLGTRWLGTPEMSSFIGLSRIYFGAGIGNQTLSIGASFNLDYGQVEMKNPLFIQGMFLGSTDTNLTGWAPSATIGGLWQPESWLKLGTSYTTPVHMSLNGRTELSSPLLGDDDDRLSTTLNYPSKLNFAALIGPQKFHFLFDANYYDFSVKNVEFRYEDWANQDNRLDWNDLWALHSGIEWIFWEGSDDSKMKLRAGYIYMSTVIPEQTRSPLLFDAPGHAISGGLGYEWKKWSVDIAYIQAFGNSDVFADHYSAKIHELAIGVSYSF